MSDLPIIRISKHTDPIDGKTIGYCASVAASGQIDDLEGAVRGEVRKSMSSALLAVAHLVRGEVLCEYRINATRTLFDDGMDAVRAERVARALLA